MFGEVFPNIKKKGIEILNLLQVMSYYLLIMIRDWANVFDLVLSKDLVKTS